MIVILAFLGLLVGAAVGDAAGAAAGVAFGVMVAQVVRLRDELGVLSRTHRDTADRIDVLKLDIEQLRRSHRAATDRLEEAHQRIEAFERRATAAPPIEATANATASLARTAAVDGQVSDSVPDSAPSAEVGEVPPAATEADALEAIPAAQPTDSSAASIDAPSESLGSLDEQAMEATPTQLSHGPFDVSAAPRPSAQRHDAQPVAVGERAFDAVREFFLGGNTVVRVGTLVLLIGVVMLLKYAADNSMFPIELRMASAAMLGVSMVAVGLRQRVARPGFSRTLQGGGIATMYLVVFFSYRMYELLPGSLAFALLAAIAASSAVLAVVQHAMALIVIGQVGGFLAPILASTGSGNHVALFSYYLLLNVAIFGVAWVRAWRPLNLLGFLFTFGIGTAWGAMQYRPDKFASTEPFLVAFFLIYVAIPVVFARRHSVKGWVDASLVFGAPLAFLGLQRSLVQDMPFAMAYTTLALAIMYIGLARNLLATAPEAMRSMAESFIALGIGFATLAVPYGLDNAGLTGATWALEGAGVYWMGVRQQRWLSRTAGIALQFMGGIALLVYLDDASAPLVAFANTRMLGATFIAFGSLFVAWYASRHADDLPGFESRLAHGLIAWGLCFLLPMGVGEILRVATQWAPGLVIAWFGVVGIALELSASRLRWTAGRIPPALSVLALLPLVLHWEGQYEVLPFERGGAIGWPLYFACMTLSLKRLVPVGPALLRYLHPIALWATTGFLVVCGARLVSDGAGLRGDWLAATMGVPMSFMLWGVLAGTKASRWPYSDAPGLYTGLGGGVLAGALLLWTLSMATAATGATAPLPYLPLLNAADLAQLLGFAAVLAWARRARRDDADMEAFPDDLLRAVPAAVGAFGFIWFNAMLARAAHQYTAMPLEEQAVMRSVPLQVAYSVSWTLIGLVVTVVASRSRRRTPWMVGAALLGVVVVKLFLVDIARLSTVAKIGTFLVVGILLLAVGYLAPVPPSTDDTDDADDADDADEPGGNEPPSPPSPPTATDPVAQATASAEMDANRDADAAGDSETEDGEERR